MVRGIAIPQTRQSITSPIIVIRRGVPAMTGNSAGGRDCEEEAIIVIAIEGRDGGGQETKTPRVGG